VGRLFGRQQRMVWLFLVPGIAYVALWRLFPALYTLYLSFTSYNLAFDPVPSWAGLANYEHLVRDAKLHASGVVTLQFAFLATLLELGLGLLTAVLLDRPFAGRNVVMGLVLVPMVLAPVTVATIWYVLFHRFVGPIPYLFRLLHGSEIGWLSGKWSALGRVIIADVWQWTPLMTLLLLAALQSVSRETVEAAMVDGAAGWRVFCHVVWPQIAGMASVAVGLRFMDAFQELDKILVMTGGGPGTTTELVAVHILRTAFQFFTLGYAAAIVVGLLVVIGLVYGIYLRRLSEAGSPLGAPASPVGG
jgi:multiple sugar transport system permease protein